MGLVTEGSHTTKNTASGLSLGLERHERDKRSSLLCHFVSKGEEKKFSGLFARWLTLTTTTWIQTWTWVTRTPPKSSCPFSRKTKCSKVKRFFRRHDRRTNVNVPDDNGTALFLHLIDYRWCHRNGVEIYDAT
jgi:hypothetical protein